MAKAKIAITIDADLLQQLDELVSGRTFANRSQAIEDSVRRRLVQLSGDRLARECARLEPSFEVELAELGMGRELETWPGY